MHTTIRRALDGDELALAELNESVQNLHADNVPSFFKRYSREETSDWFKRFLSKENTEVWLAEEDGEPVGYASIVFQEQPETPFCRERRYLQIDQISIRSDRQCSGIGRELIEHILKSSRQAGIRDVELSCWSFNDGAQEAFKRLGFSPRIVRLWQDALPNSSAPARNSPSVDL
jgi:diamine N-acetyltransferase